MTRQEYLDSLKHELGDLSYNEVNDIVADISEHFDIGAMQNKSDDEIIAGLGSAKELAQDYLNGGSYKDAIKRNRKPNPKSVINKTTQPTEKDYGGARICVVLFNIFVGVPGLLLLAVIEAVYAALFTTLVISFANFVQVIPDFGDFMSAGVCLAITNVLLLIFLFTLFYFAVKYFIRLIVLYARLNKKIWNEGF